MTASNDITEKDASTTKPKALTLYGKMLTFSRMQLNTNDLVELESTLGSLLTNKTSQIPIVIDSVVEQDLSKLVELLWSWGLQPIGVVDGILKEQAVNMRLAVFPSDGKRIESLPHTASNITAKAIAAPAIATTSTATNTAATNRSDAPSVDDASYHKLDTKDSNMKAQTQNSEADLLPTKHSTHMVYNQMLRSGQSINHVGGDLILTNSINNGAEVITDNSLHIYGKASGRLVAGATGDKNARIFCQSFNPSLVSVAGTYCLRDSMPEEMMDKPVQVSYIEGEGLKFEIMNSA